MGAGCRSVLQFHRGGRCWRGNARCRSGDLSSAGVQFCADHYERGRHQQRSPITVSFNGGYPLTIKSNSGNDIAPGGLQCGTLLLARISGSIFQIVNDQVRLPSLRRRKPLRRMLRMGSSVANGYRETNTGGGAIAESLVVGNNFPERPRSWQPLTRLPIILFEFSGKSPDRDS